MARMPADVRDPETYVIIGAAMEAHTILGHGFLEHVYQEALARELTARGIPFRRAVELVIWYKGMPLDCKFKADFVCYESVVVETKAIKQLTDVDRAQVINYLKATRHRRGLLFNFGAVHLEYERLVNSFV